MTDGDIKIDFENSKQGHVQDLIGTPIANTLSLGSALLGVYAVTREELNPYLIASSLLAYGFFNFFGNVCSKGVARFDAARLYKQTQETQRLIRNFSAKNAGKSLENKAAS